MIGLKPEPFASAGDDLMDLPSHDENFDSQHMLLGFELLRWQFQDYLKEVAFIDPYLTTMYLRDEDVPQRELLKKTLQDFGESDSRVLLCPIWSAKTICHWTLLTAERVEGKWSFRYRDTLADPVERFLEEGLQYSQPFAEGRGFFEDLQLFPASWKHMWALDSCLHDGRGLQLV